MLKNEEPFRNGYEMLAPTEAPLAKLLVGKVVKDKIVLKYLDDKSICTIKDIVPTNLFGRSFYFES